MNQFKDGDIEDEDFRRLLIDLFVNSVTVWDEDDDNFKITIAYNLTSLPTKTYRLGKGGTSESDLVSNAPEKEAPQYGDFADDPGEELPDIPRPGLYMVYTDGSCIGNGSKTAPGGWAAVVAVPGGGEVERSGGAKGTTNNRRELIAAIKGLSKVPRGAKVKLVSDSQYVINGLQKGWAKSWRRNGWYKSDGKKALNPDLWKTLLELTEQRQLFYEWVRGHNGHRYNERCDRLAMQQAERLL